MDLYRIARRLQLALCKQGRRVKINHVQYFSKLTGNPATLYVATETRILPGGKQKSIELCSSTRMSDVVKVLAGLLRDRDDGGE